jgi:hypothetical protein
LTDVIDGRADGPRRLLADVSPITPLRLTDAASCTIATTLRPSSVRAAARTCISASLDATTGKIAARRCQPPTVPPAMSAIRSGRPMAGNWRSRWDRRGRTARLSSRMSKADSSVAWTDSRGCCAVRLVAGRQVVRHRLRARQGAADRTPGAGDR